MTIHLVYLTPNEKRALHELRDGTFDHNSTRGRKGAARGAMLWRLSARGYVSLDGGRWAITDEGRTTI